LKYIYLLIDVGKSDQAKEILANAVKANPLRAEAWMAYALATAQTGGDDETILELLNKALQLDPPKCTLTSTI
jgi:hypothetical protein